MKFFTRIAVLLYVTMVLFLGSFLILFSANYLNFNDILWVLVGLYSDETLRMILGCLGGVLLVVNFGFYRMFSVNVHRDKIIAFDNPSGRVSVSLGAIEELVKRTISQSSEVNDVKAKIVASKKGLHIKIRLALRYEGNIPEITSRVQNLVKMRIQDTIGVEESLDITVYVGRIFPTQSKNKQKTQAIEAEEPSQKSVPFQGYRA